MKDDDEDAPLGIVDPCGRPVHRRREPPKACARCHAQADKRVPSAGFGERRAICGVCGHDTGEAWDD